MKQLTKKELDTIHEVLVAYDTARKAEGYSIAYRRWAEYSNLSAISQEAPFGRHCETMYLNRENGKPLLVKVLPDGTVSAFEAVS